MLVSNVPGRNAVAVAELTMGLILALDRRIADNVVDARQGRWAKATYSKANGLLGSTLGILGMGSIGLAVAERAAGFGMRIGCLDRPGRSRATCDRLAELDVVGHRSLPELLASSDVVSLHLPSSAETKNLVDADFLSAMRPGTILVNTSRGDVVDEAALLAALDAGHVRAGLDVFAHEPASSTAEWDQSARQAPSGGGHPPHRRLHRDRPRPPSPRGSWRSSTRSRRERRATASTSHRAGWAAPL